MRHANTKLFSGRSSGLEGMVLRLQQVFAAADDAGQAAGPGGAAGAAATASSRELYDDDLDAGGATVGASLCVLRPSLAGKVHSQLTFGHYHEKQHSFPQVVKK